MKKKGFTLIELLAVILVLAVTALIAIPTVIKIINESKKEAFKTTVNNVIVAIENACRLQALKGEVITSTYTFTNGIDNQILNIKVKSPLAGTATVDASCNVAINVNNGEFSAKKIINENSVTVVEGIEAETSFTEYTNGTAIYFNPVSGEKCTAGEAVSTTGTKTGCMKWYTFNDSGDTSDTINLILDHNTTAIVAWNSTGSNINGPTNIMTQLASDTSSWVGVPTRTDSYNVNNGTAMYTINYSTYKARLITAAEIAKITNNINFNEKTATNSKWFYFDSNNQTQTAIPMSSSSYYWLYDYTNDCTSSGCNIADASNYGYWTATPVFNDASNSWIIDRRGRFYFLPINSSGRGVRPVITISKKTIK